MNVYSVCKCVCVQSIHTLIFVKVIGCKASVECILIENSYALQIQIQKIHNYTLLF